MDSSQKPPKNRIEELVDSLPPQNLLSKLESELIKVDPRALGEAERESWHHWYGVVAFQRGGRRAAFERFMEGASQCPSSAKMAFSLGQEYEARGDPNQMLACFDRALFPKVSGPYALAEARYAYLWGNLPKAVGYLRPLLQAYFQLRVADDTFLHIRGMPFFGVTWAYFTLFSVLEGKLGEAIRLTEDAAKNLKDYDFEHLFLQLRCLEKNDFSPKIQELQKRLNRKDRMGHPPGYENLQLAVLRAQGERDLVVAENLIRGAVVGEGDFPWLEDMRVLALAETAYRRKDAAGERTFVDRFMRKQPLLFEPDHALNFHLFSYQERLKPHYQKLKRNSGNH